MTRSAYEARQRRLDEELRAVLDAWLSTETLGRGRYPTVYRRMHSAASAPDSGDGAETA